VANVINPGTFHPRRVNQYVRAMQYASDVNYGGRTRISFGRPLASSSNNILAATNATVAGNYDTTGVAAAPEPFGRTVQVAGVANTAAGSSVTIRGYDYLNQPMTEALTTVAGVTVIQGIKAFKSIILVSIGANGGAAPNTISVGWGAKLGLPYRAIAQSTEVANGVPTATQGTFVAGPFAQTNNAVGQADPRGTYQPNTAFTSTNGANGNLIDASFDFANDLSGVNCGLMGFPHAG